MRLALVVLASTLAACSPGTSTIGGWDPAALKARGDAAATACRARTGQMPPNAFTTDGCTLVPDGTWQACCVDHDADYWCGGSADDRRRSDATFRVCLVNTTGSQAMAGLYYGGVRVGAPPWMPVPWRWSYGWPWPHGYTAP